MNVRMPCLRRCTVPGVLGSTIGRSFCRPHSMCQHTDVVAVGQSCQSCRCEQPAPADCHSHTSIMRAKIGIPKARLLAHAHTLLMPWSTHPRLLMAMTTSSKLLLPARSPMPLMVHSS